MKNRILLTLLLLLPAMTNGQDNSGALKIYGEVSNFAAYQSRKGYMDDIGLYYLLPADKNLNEVGMDLNDEASFRFLSLASKLGLDWSGYSSGSMKLSARMEADFYCANGVKSVLRLRHAYFSAGWNWGKWKAFGITAGQTWHPMAADRPHSLALSCGAPFNPYSYAPQVCLEYPLGDKFGLSLAALWQTNYCSTGPDGYSTQYIEWGCIPEFNFQLAFQSKDWKAKVGANYLSIKPRNNGLYPFTEVYVPVGDKCTSLCAFAYGEYSGERLDIRAKAIYAQSGEHLMMMGGYAITDYNMDTGRYYYTPFNSTSAWLSAGYGKALKGYLTLAYMQNLGTKETIFSTGGIFFNNDAWNLERCFRVAPGIVYQWKHLKVGAEYEYTGARYGDKDSFNLSTGLATENLRWIFAHRFTILLACTF